MDNNSLIGIFTAKTRKKIDKMEEEYDKAFRN